MRIELRILSGARAGTVRSFDQPTIRVGRAPDCDLRFDAEADLDVSAHHAELRQAASGYEIADVGSRNGTLLNGQAISARASVDTGDEISFGANGPRIGARLESDGVARGDYSARRVAVAVNHQTIWVWRLLYAAIALLAIVAGAGYLIHRRQTAVSRAEMARLVAANQAASVAFQARLRNASDSELASEVRRRNDTLVARARATNGVRGGGTNAAKTALASELARSNAMQLALADMDLSTVREQNDSAMVLIAAEVGGHAQQASGFSVSPGGLIVTNRHVVQDSSGSATRIAVKFANTRGWRPAHLVRVASDSAVDLALIQMNDPGPYPTVRGLSAGGPDVAVGAPIAALGFAPTADSGGAQSDAAVARTSFSTGTINRALIGLLQIDAFAGRGSSGSPVFDRHGHVIGVIWGGVSSAGRVVYAVPSDRLLPMLPGSVRAAIGASGH